MRSQKQRKRSLKVIFILMCITLFIYFVFPTPLVNLSKFEKRAVWLSYVDLEKLDYSTKESFEKGFKEILDDVSYYNGNTLIVHVRPFGDALYFSKLFPISKVICHKTSLSFDPLKVMVNMAHQRKIALEAWVNPYRISTSRNTFQNFIDSSSKKKWLEDGKKTIGYKEYCYIFNPASEEVRDYIVAGIQEIVENYDVDGIHFDDYFYVEGTHENTSKNERLDNVNMLIQDVYATIKSVNSHVTFGISPQGNYENCVNEGADVDTWLSEEGFVDYVMPQLYWSNQYGKDVKTKLFTQRAKIFSGLKRRKGIKLHAGLALYRANKKDDLDQGWKKSNYNISQQVQILYENGYDGYSLFDYSSMKNKAGKKELQHLIQKHNDKE